ncbi:hypothetical protein GE09DRAFT_1055919 [Coniochaeta sp. 2T2.1]|nr:hypothetical protein GE09DRAFT_1055919 [Coniochaeta sp. 2T2.1]
MRFKLAPLLTFLTWFLRPVDSVSSFMTPTDEDQQMESWENTDETTWLAHTKVNQAISLPQLYTIANAHFNWVKNQRKPETSGGTLLVAALYVPTVQTVFASTIPRDKSLIQQLAGGSDLSPVWHSRTENLMPGPAGSSSASLFHAEDSTYFHFESTTRTYSNLVGNDDGAKSQKYPSGTLLAVWGYYPNDSMEKKRTGRPIDLCDSRPRRNQRSPTCQQMAKSLGVYFELVTNETPEEMAANTNPDFATENTDPNACAGGGGPQRRHSPGDVKFFRRNTTCSSISQVSHTYLFDPTPLTIPLDVTTSASTTVTEPPTTTDQARHTITSAPTLSCVLHNQDPGHGITKAYCLCNKSITLSPLPSKKAYSESCAYTTMPGTSASEIVPTQTQVWTTNCQACTIVGGVANEETCTPVAGCKPTAAPVPTIAAWVGNLSTIDIGNAEDGNNGTDLAKEMFSKLRGMCNSTTCKGDDAVMDNVETIAGGELPLKPAMHLEYVALARGALHRRLREAQGVPLHGPDVQGAQRNQLEKTAGDGFLCELITEALTAAVLFLAPELLAPDVLADVDLQAICGWVADPASIIGSLTETVHVSRP